MLTLLEPTASAAVPPRSLRLVGAVWLLVLAVRPIPLLVAVLTKPDLANVLSGPPRVASVLLTVAAVLACMWWGDALARAGRGALAVWSVGVAVLVTLVWGFLLTSVWRAQGADVNPEAAWALLGLCVVMTILATGVAIAVGYVLGPRLRATLDYRRTMSGQRD